jgi:hypothetical protein
MDIKGQALTAGDRLFILMQAGLYLTTTRGFAAPEALACYERAESLCVSLSQPLVLLSALRGLWRYSLVTNRLSATPAPLCSFGWSKPTLVLPRFWLLYGAFPNPERRAVDSTINAGLVLSLRSAILFPTSLIPKKDVVVSGRQSMRTPLSSDIEANAKIIEDFPGCTGCAIGPPLICRSWVPKASAGSMPPNPWNRFLAISIKLDDSRASAF